MIKNYLRIIVRQLRKNKIYTVFSIISLTIGLVCSIFAYMYVTSETSYESFLENANRIVRLEFKSSFTKGNTVHYATAPDQYIISQLSSIPAIQQKTRIAPLPRVFVQPKGTNRFIEKWGMIADSSFFDVFDFNIVAGNKNNPLDEPSSIVLTQKTAQRYFEDNNPIGEQLLISYGQNESALTVTAVMENVPVNSHLKFDFLVSESVSQSLYDIELSEISKAYQYLLLNKNINLKALGKKLNQLKTQSSNKYLKYTTYILQPITQIHLYSNARWELKPGGSIGYVTIFAIVALVILIISCINYISLFLSEAVHRFKGMKIRKVLGANSYQLVAQLLLESTLIALISFIIALVVGVQLLPLFNVLVDETFTAKDIFSFGLLWKGALFAIIIGMISALYPAWIIYIKSKKYRPDSISIAGKRKNAFQNAIVIFQFIASAVLIVGTLVVYSQLNYIQQKDLGFNSQRIITLTNYLHDQLPLFKKLLADNNNIKAITASSYIPGVSETGGTGLVKSLTTGKEVTASWISVEPNYFEIYGLMMIKGRAFSKQYATDSTQAFIVNKATVKALGLKNPIGERVIFGIQKGNIIGVVQNFNYLSLHQQIPLMIFNINDDLYFSISIKLAKNADIPTTLNQIEKVWYSVLPNVPFQYTFLQDKMHQLYNSERNMGRSVFTFALIAIFISCLGLFSLAAYSMQKRTKEIGIRKVLGATVQNILTLFYSKYFKLILIANVIAIPLAYFLSRYWLQNFAYKIEITVLPFIISFITTCLITILALSYWGLKAANLNPVDSIRTE